MNLEMIFGSAIITSLISGMVGVIGMLYLGSILGMLFAFIPFIIWRIYVGRFINKITSQQSTVDEVRYE